MDSPPFNRRWLALALLAMTQFVLILDTAIVIVAAPSMESGLGFSPEGLSWVANAYTLTFGGLLLLGGRAGDIIGRRKMFIGGLSLFALGSLAGALSTTPAMLIAARAAQGVGAAAVSPAALALVMTLFTEAAERNRALGIWGSVAGAGAATGSIFGGFLTQWFGWQAVLWVNVPIVAIVVALAPRLLPEAKESTHRSFDLAGAITVTAGISLGVYALVNAEHAGWASGQTLGLLALSVALLAAFVVIEARSSHPLISLRIFRIRSLRNGNVLTLLMTASMMPMFFFLTLYMQRVLHFSPIESGLGQVPAALSFALLGTPIAKLVSRIGYRIPAAGGGVLAGVGIFWLSRFGAHGTYLGDILVPMTVAALGASLSFISLMIAATSEAPVEDAGLASGLINTTQQIGGAIGLAALSSVAASSTGRAVSHGAGQLSALTTGFGSGLALAAITAAVTGVLGAVVLRRTARNRLDATNHKDTVTARAERHVVTGVQEETQSPNSVIV